MIIPSKSIVLIGFKHVGKSVIGRALSQQLAMNVIDLDEAIEQAFDNENQSKRSCREIMTLHGQSYFRGLEKKVLAQVLQSAPSVISLGGGTPMDEDNQVLIKQYTVIHIQAPRELVFERIMTQGRPAFFSAEDDPLETFNRLWNERAEIYKTLADFSIDNNDAVGSAVGEILKQLHARHPE